MTTPDYTAIKTRQQATWAAGDYAKVGTSLQWVGEHLAETLDLSPGARVLDVAAGNGNATLAFARRGAAVVSTDYVECLLEQGRARAEAEGLSVDFKVADAEALPFESSTFDAVVSTFGVMFAPNHLVSARELLRVCRPNGTIGLSNWTPDGFIGQLFVSIGKHVPPPAGVQSPARWGDRAWIEETFAPHRADLQVTEHDFVFRYASPAQFVDFFRTYYGPVHKAFAALDAAGQAALTADLLALVARFNSRADSMRVPSRYVEVVMRRQAD